MPEPVTLLIVVAKAVVLVAGLTILFYTGRAANRTADGGLWLLSAGLLLTGSGLFFTGLLPGLIEVDPTIGLAVTSLVSAVGLILVIYSMFTNLRVPS
ncbi:MAG: hypothetical protein V5A43_08775 [Haloarculaceae archaeon]